MSQYHMASNALLKFNKHTSYNCADVSKRSQLEITPLDIYYSVDPR